MSVVNIDQLPGHARLWVFAAEKPLEEAQLQSVQESMRTFIEQWTAHKRELTATWEVRHNRFILVGVDESSTPVSGCSIDSLVRHLRQLEQTLGNNIVNTSGKIFFRDREGDIHCVERAEFRRLAETGAVNEETMVFDNTIQRAADLHAGRWELPMKESWHMDVFGDSVVA